LKEAVEKLEGEMIQRALEHHPTEIAAARSLGIHATTLWRKASKYGIK
jgi:transcriptional regulator with PAS, ATPase and Fis domain